MEGDDVRYTIDSNVLIHLKNYVPIDVFPSVWMNLEALGSSGRLCICRNVLDELERGGDELFEWVKTRIATTPCEPGDAEVLTVADIAVNFEGWVNGRENEADPWIVAHGKIDGRVVVTDENPGGPLKHAKNQKIPYVAAQYGVVCKGFYEMARDESWRF